MDDKELEKIRNVAIIAHIDAGKTTTTERMLFFAGVLEEPGEVHHGNTVMDYMKEERERGITIRSACISFNWNGHQVNLIDTPGHIDFNLEVERSLQVLDGAVVIIDGVNGVETQSETVWRQANKFGIAKLVFINKLDRIGGNFEKSVSSIESKLNCKVLISQLPVIKDDSVKCILDVVSMKVSDCEAAIRMGRQER